MSIQQNFPAITPSLSLNFARSKTLDPRITFTRTSSGTRVNETGLVEVVPTNAPRFDHSYDPVSGSVRSLGLLVEEARTNLLLRSEEFNDASWTKTNAGITTNTTATTAPDGTNNAEKLVENTANGQHFIGRANVLTNSLQYTLSVFAKPTERTKMLLGAVKDDGNFVGTYFDLSVGTAYSTFATPDAYSIVSYSNGWYRCNVTITNSATGSSDSIGIYLLDASGNFSYTGDGTSGIFIWGAQLEVGAFPTSYIPTVASTVTRTADNASITGSNFSDFFNPSEGTTVIQIQNYNISNTSTSLLSYSGTTVPNNSMNYFRQLDAQPVGQIVFNGTASMNIGLGAVWTDSSLQKHVFFYQKDNSGIANRSLVSLDTSVDIPVVERMNIGSISTLQTNNKFTLSQITYYPSRLTNAQLQTLTK